MRQRGCDRAGDEKNRIVFAQHRERRGRSGGDRPNKAARLESTQKAIGRDRPGRQQGLVCAEALAEELIEWRQQEQEQHRNPLVAVKVPSRNPIGCVEPDCRVGHCQQVKRPIGWWKQGKPRSCHEAGERRVLVIPCRWMQTPGVGLQGVRVETDRSGGNDPKRRIEKHKPQQKKPGGKSARCIIEPSSKRPSEPPVLRLEIGRHTHDALFVASLEDFSAGLNPPGSLPGLTRQSSIHCRCALDRPVKPGDDTMAGRDVTAAGVMSAGSRASTRQNGRTGNGCREDPAKLRDDTAPRTPAIP